MPSTTKNYRWGQAANAPKSCAKGSFRIKKRSTRLLRFCCPKGKWSKRTQSCRVGMRLEAIGQPKKRRSR